jgi:hypothetical protein
MLASFVAGLAGIFFDTTAIFLGKIAYLFLHYELSVIRFFAELPFASVSVPDFPLILTILIYGIFCVVLFRSKPKTRGENVTAQ